MKTLMLPITMLLLLAATVQAQKKQRASNRHTPKVDEVEAADSLWAYRELVALGKWYLNMPLQVKIHFVANTTPPAGQQSNEEVNLLLYYGRNDFYMQAGGLEQIVNDSFTVLVNNEAKIIKLYNNPHALAKTMENIIPAFTPDSSLQQLARQYSINIRNEEKNIREMTVQSRATVSGTPFAKETITIRYQHGSHQPISYWRVKRSLVPVDATTYKQLEADTAYTQRMLQTTTAQGDLYFVMKEKTTECRFEEVNHRQQLPPVLQEDRIVKNDKGEYTGAKGFEEYLVDF